MKKISTILAVCCTLLLLAPCAPRAQSIEINSVSATSFCAGDPVSVTFTATGAWQHKNAFTLQLSNDSGSFDNGFQNIGSIQDTESGTFTIFSSIPFGNIYRKFNITRNIYPQDSAIFVDTVIVYKIPNDTTYDTMSIPHRVTVYDTIYDTTFPTHYRLRIMGANPYTVSADNGTDLIIGQAPELYQFASPTQIASDSILVTATGIGIKTPFGVSPTDGVTTLDQLYWTFGDGSDPSTAQTQYGYPNGGVVNVTYSTAGLKTVTVTSVSQGGCSISDTTYVRVFDCTDPVIPNNAIVISNDTATFYWEDSLGNAYRWNDTTQEYDTTQQLYTNPAACHPRTFWVNPGVTLYAGATEWGHNTCDTIFAEAGANIIGEGGAIVYLKPGATTTYPPGLVIYADGASIIDNDNKVPTLECNSLTFDYTAAPPNSIMHINDGTASVANANIALEQIALSPNPTNGIVAVQGVPVSAQVQVMNVLGVAVQEVARTTESNFTIDLTSFAAGTYYVRIASNNGVTTKKVVKE